MEYALELEKIPGMMSVQVFNGQPWIDEAYTGPSATLDCGDITVVLTKNRASLCRPDIFESIDLGYKKFRTAAVKPGSLFPELAAKAERAILAFTPGASTERPEDMGLTRIRRPMYPLDNNFLN